MYAIRILTNQPFRLFLTLSGISLCVILIMFILGVYHGVAEGSIEYIKKSNADLWVLQKNSTNIMRGTSIMPASYIDVIKEVEQIENVAPVLLFLTNIVVKGKNATVILTGYRPGDIGGPPIIIKGRKIISNNEIVLDNSFATKHKIGIGDKIKIKDDKLDIVGLSSGTNAFVTQYAFVTLEFEQSIIEFGDLVSFFMVKVKNSESLLAVKDNIEKKLPGKISVFTYNQFLKNNIAEMEAGILPLFYSIAAIGAVVLAIILSLILSVNILERRKDFAIMKIIGSPGSFLDMLILTQALILSLVSEVIAVLLFFPLVKLIKIVSPEVTTRINSEHIIYITIIICILSILSAYFSSRRIRKIYPLEVFS